MKWELRKHEDVCSDVASLECCGEDCCCGWYVQVREGGIRRLTNLEVAVLSYSMFLVPRVLPNGEKLE